MSIELLLTDRCSMLFYQPQALKPSYHPRHLKFWSAVYLSDQTPTVGLQTVEPEQVDQVLQDVKIYELIEQKCHFQKIDQAN